MADIFLGYAREDRDKAETIAAALEQHGWSVWWDVKIPAGRTFDEVIEEAITAAECVIVLWSAESVTKRWVKTEADEGMRREVLVPVMVEKVPPPFAFRLIQAADLVGWDGDTTTQEFADLAASIESIVKPRSTTADVSVDTPPSPAMVRPGKAVEAVPPASSDDDPADYVPDDEFQVAADLAVKIGLPLLLTGESGVGKSAAASHIAYQHKFGTPLVFLVRRQTTARDLYYHYNAQGHLRDTQLRRGSRDATEASQPDPEDYITYEALGLATLLAMDPNEADPFLPEGWRDVGPVRSVVLIDEIDKADPDVIEDILREIDRREFTVEETGRTFRADVQFKPIVVLTSNSRQALPEAALRRCVSHQLSFPTVEHLREILARRLGNEPGATEVKLYWILDRFLEIREMNLARRPGIGELINWGTALLRMDLPIGDSKDVDEASIASTYSLLASDREDRWRLSEWARERSQSQW